MADTGMAGVNSTFSSTEVTVDHMDYTYIEKCSNEKELARILRALRTGREGYYPDLIEFCEKKLRSINSDHRALRKQQPILKAWDLGQDDLADLNKDMDHWASHMKTMDEEATEKKIFESTLQGGHSNGFADRGDVPPVRGSKIIKGGKGKAVNDCKTPNPNRIKSSDYKAWDKFDVDQECEKIDQEASTPAPGPKPVKISRTIDASNLSDEEKRMKAVKEKEKGNEAFKSGDFEEALSYYCRSICLHPIAASYNNRALVYLRLEKWKDAVNDCNTVLQLEGESNNLKALLRRATAYKSLKRYDDASSDIHFVLEKEPNNARAKSILDDIQKFKNVQNEQPIEEASNSAVDEAVEKKGKKMMITEVEGDSSDENQSSPRTEDVASSSQESATEGKVPVKNQNPPKTDNVKLSSQQSTTEEKVTVKKEDTIESIANEQSSEAVETATSKATENQTTEANDPKENTEPVEESSTVQQHVNPVFPPKTAQYKAEAAQFFKAGRYTEACESYSKAISSLSTFLEHGNTDLCYKLACAVLYNNRAACKLKQGDDKACIEDCNKVLEIKSWDIKAFMRRGSAYENIEKYKNAWADYQSAYSMDRQNAFAQNGANRVSNHLREIYGGKWREKVPKVETYPYQSITNLPNINKMSQNQQVVESVSEKVIPPTNVASESKENTVMNSMQKDESKNDVTSKNPVQKQNTQKETKKKQNKKKRNKSKSKSPQRIETPSPTVEEIEKENKRIKIRQELYQKLKGEGNDLVKSGKYKEAIENYTRCLSLCPKEPASYTNRALCFLKLKKHVSAINDCTEAIKLEPCNVKAYYRRAQARKAEGYHKDALRDVKKLLDIDPGNKAAQNELENLKKLTLQTETCAAKTESKPQTERRKQMVIEEVDSSDSSDEGEFVLPKENFQCSADKIPQQEPNVNKNEAAMESIKQQMKKVLGNEEDSELGPQSFTKSSPQPKSQEQVPRITIENNSEAAKNASTQQIKKMPSNDKVNEVGCQSGTKSSPQSQSDKLAEERPSSGPSINVRLQDSKPLTPYEFGNLWSAIANKNNSDEYKALLLRVSPTELPTLISNKIDDHVIKTVATVALEQITMNNDCKYAYDMLSHLTKAKRFGMASMFMEPSDKKALKDVFHAMRKYDSVSTNEIKVLETLYGV